MKSPVSHVLRDFGGARKTCRKQGRDSNGNNLALRLGPETGRYDRTRRSGPCKRRCRTCHAAGQMGRRAQDGTGQTGRAQSTVGSLEVERQTLCILQWVVREHEYMKPRSQSPKLIFPYRCSVAILCAHHCKLLWRPSFCLLLLLLQSPTSFSQARELEEHRRAAEEQALQINGLVILVLSIQHGLRDTGNIEPKTPGHRAGHCALHHTRLDILRWCQTTTVAHGKTT